MMTRRGSGNPADKYLPTLRPLGSNGQNHRPRICANPVLMVVRIDLRRDGLDVGCALPIATPNPAQCNISRAPGMSPNAKTSFGSITHTGQRARPASPPWVRFAHHLKHDHGLPVADPVLAAGPPPMAQFQIGQLPADAVGRERGQPVPVDIGEPQLRTRVWAFGPDDDPHPFRPPVESITPVSSATHAPSRCRP